MQPAPQDSVSIFVVDNLSGSGQVQLQPCCSDGTCPRDLVCRPAPGRLGRPDEATSQICYQCEDREGYPCGGNTSGGVQCCGLTEFRTSRAPRNCVAADSSQPGNTTCQTCGYNGSSCCTPESLPIIQGALSTTLAAGCFGEDGCIKDLSKFGYDSGTTTCQDGMCVKT
jgi:hypothetical protein